MFDLDSLSVPVSKRLSLILNSRERSEAEAMLSYLGLYYFYTSSNTPFSYTNLLNFTRDVFNSIDSNKKNELSSKIKKLDITNTIEEDLKEDVIKESLNNENSPNFYRQDFHKKYPFNDSHSVEKILTSTNSSYQENILSTLLTSPISTKKKILEEVFNEYKFDYRGIRMSDLPEALKSIGLELPATLANLLTSLRCRDVHGVVLNNHVDLELEGEDEEETRLRLQWLKEHPNEKYIIFSQWFHLVLKYLNKRRKNNSKLKFEEMTDWLGYPISLKGKVEDDIDIDFNKKNIQSKIKNYIDKDRNQYYHNKKKENLYDSRSSKESDIDFESKNYSRDYLSNWNTTSNILEKGQLHDPIVADSNSFYGEKILKNKSEKENEGQKLKLKKNLLNESNSTNIANEFLKSKVGKEILYAPSESEFDLFQENDDDSLSTQSRIAQILGIEKPSKKKKEKRDISLYHTSNDSSSSISTSSISTLPVKPIVKERCLELQRKQQENEGASGWVAKSKGWVADFGPPHTHTYFPTTIDSPTPNASNTLSSKYADNSEFNKENIDKELTKLLKKEKKFHDQDDEFEFESQLEKQNNLFKNKSSYFPDNNDENISLGLSNNFNSKYGNQIEEEEVKSLDVPVRSSSSKKSIPSSLSDKSNKSISSSSVSTKSDWILPSDQISQGSLSIDDAIAGAGLGDDLSMFDI